MNPRINQVKSLENYQLEVIFTNNEKKIFDVKPYLDRGAFVELKDITVFNSAKPFNGTVVWSNELDFCPDTIYLESKSI